MSVLVPLSASVDSASAVPRSVESVITAKQPVSPTSQPTVTGTTIIGNRLTAVAGTWGTTAVTFRYQWNRDGAAIPSGTNPTYLLKPDDADKRMSVTVTGSSPGYLPVSRTSTTTLKVVRPFVTTLTTSVMGSAVVGETVSIELGAWTPAPSTFGYRWTLDGVEIAAAHDRGYVVQQQDAGKLLEGYQTISRSGYETKTERQLHRIVLDRFSSTPAPMIVGSPLVGATLRAEVPAWTPVADGYRYYWLRDDALIFNGNDPTYTVVKADRGKRISVAVGGARTGFLTVYQTSLPTEPVR